MLELLQMTTYEGGEYQVCQIEDITEANGCGEPEYLYHLLNRHGDVRQVTDHEHTTDINK